MYTVYLVTFPNNNKYVGFTEKGIVERKRTHYSSVNSKKRTPMKNALKKYKGMETWEVLNCYETKELALKMESLFIEKYDSTNTGYNVQTGGQYCPPTRVKKGIKVIDCRGNIFETYTECANFYGVTIRNVIASCENKWRIHRKYCVKVYEKGDKKCPKYKKTRAKKILCVNNNKIYNKAEEAAVDLDLPNSLSINRVCRRERTNYKGFVFRYIEETESA